MQAALVAAAAAAAASAGDLLPDGLPQLGPKTALIVAAAVSLLQATLGQKSFSSNWDGSDARLPAPEESWRRRQAALRLWPVLLACTLPLEAIAERNITYSPLDRKVAETSYGKLPASVQVWAVACVGPLDLAEARRFAVMAGWPVLMRSQVEAIVLRGQRSAWLTVVPEAVSFGSWALPQAFRSGWLKALVPAAVQGGAEVVRRLPAGAPAEKRIRAVGDVCDYAVSLKPGQDHECAMFTQLSRGRAPEVFRIVVPDPPAPGGSQ